MKLHIVNPARFSCQRICTPGHECQFSPVLQAIGPSRVMSHTVHVEVVLKDKGLMAAAIVKMGGTIIGQGTHKLYGSTETGYGFNLPGWKYPLILRGNNTLAFDDYHSHWGDPADIQKLTGHYAIEAARQAADSKGWMSDDLDNGGLEIHHPSGASMTVQPDGTVDAVGFIGDACDVASVIEDAMGNPGAKTFKPERWEVGGVRN